MKVINVQTSVSHKVTVSYNHQLKEYTVKLYKWNGSAGWINLSNSNYYTDDRVDAINTAEHMLLTVEPIEC